MYRWQESALLLNKYARELPGGDMALHIHGWGVDVLHFDNPVHKHSSVEICCVLDGEGIYKELDNSYPLRPGTLFCSRPGVTHQIRSDSGLALLHVSFELDELRSRPEGAEKYRRLTETPTVCVHEAAASASASLWRALLVPEGAGQALPTEQLPAAAALLIASLCHLFAPDAAAQTRPVTGSSVHLLERGKRYIRDNLEAPLTLQEVASYLHISPRHLSRLFGGGIHESFSRFIRRERVSRAAHLLRQTEQPIAEIAEHCGFGSVHAFTRTFTRERGLSPGKYRRGGRTGQSLLSE
ncbi:helix-turn-helix domain-containing protein [Paenibacillus sp. 1P07SE]|uniref:helix-turn-helix domain-containing protein n=1 Tax=Paenibacillus sp. 1P07SE TaxID=3132209 RepID=UPI0039A42F59